MGSVKPALTHFFPGISTPHHQHKHWDAVFNEAPHSILPRINIARIAQRGVFTQPGSFAEAAPPLAWQDARHSNRKRSPQGAEPRKSARFQPVATARTAACLSPYAARRRQSAQSPRRRVAENAKYPTNGPTRWSDSVPCRQVRRCWCGERYRPWQAKTIKQSRMLLTEVAYQRCAQ